ncbi:MDR family oxidoreductase [Variovorax paradoxus]|jgi:acrylyl-CoA reductase (NADPH)|uniref:Acrylyl-CoA reductase AcuI n=1 Tax=Variovorax paradoxus TaxID=34073 RepID=A0A0H2MP18_VARPD|nr:MDR family oxidoreductase [Variovorax paradoxus]KLN58425.1 acrylyl-CoA reductase AcuI [Variovorax paradoxus]
MFNALVLEQPVEGTKVPRASIQSLDNARLPEGDVTVRVAYSTLNYKDGLAITGRAPVVRQYPMVPGIDFAGTVEASDNGQFRVGDPVFANGWGMGETRWGGLTQVTRVPAKYLQHLPKGMTARQAMCIGTAGYTAMLCVLALVENGVRPDSGEILVTGANGGVGSYATALLAARGYQVCASTGRAQHTDALKALGASEVIDRATLSAPGKPLGKERWAGVVDSVGSHTLANACATVRYGGVVAACGMAQGLDFPGSVAPFILRGVKLIGIDSVYAPMEARQLAWASLAEIDPGVYDKIASEISLPEVVDYAQRLMEGSVRGRVLVNLNV